MRVGLSAGLEKLTFKNNTAFTRNANAHKVVGSFVI